jgi:hypothetical protein
MQVRLIYRPNLLLDNFYKLCLTTSHLKLFLFWFICFFFGSYPKTFVYRTRQFFNWEIPINLIRAPNFTRPQMSISADSDKLARNMCLDKHSELLHSYDYRASWFELRYDPISRFQIWKHISHWAVNDETQSSTKPKKTYTTNNHSHENLEISMLTLKKTRARL